MAYLFIYSFAGDSDKPVRDHITAIVNLVWMVCVPLGATLSVSGAWLFVYVSSTEEVKRRLYSIYCKCITAIVNIMWMMCVPLGAPLSVAGVLLIKHRRDKRRTPLSVVFLHSMCIVCNKLCVSSNKGILTYIFSACSLPCGTLHKRFISLVCQLFC